MYVRIKLDFYFQYSNSTYFGMQNPGYRCNKLLMTNPASFCNQISEADNDLSVTACDSTPVVMSDPVNITDHASETENLILNQNGM